MSTSRKTLPQLWRESRHLDLRWGIHRPSVGMCSPNRHDRQTYIGANKFEDMMRSSKAFFAGGCFWGTEYYFQRAPGVIGTRVGYMGGNTENPTYKEVCSGRTGHAEALEVVFDPDVTTYESLARLFFEIHDPTQMDRQGPDVGSQYRSAVYYEDDEQRQTAERLVGILMGKGLNVVTEIEPATTFWPAENYHQQYYDHTGKTPYCHFYTKRFDE